MAKSLKQLREEARACQDCPLWANATQTVFGAGDPHARVMLVGEQPGDEEDKKGLPFVGPAGRLLDRALEAAGVDRERSVRHQRGEALQMAAARQAAAAQDPGAARGRRLPPVARARDRRREARTSSSRWAPTAAQRGDQQGLQGLGACAASSSRARSRPVVFATLHPSALLRLREEREGELAFEQFVGPLADQEGAWKRN